ncbi:MAG: Gfo/Idh/MocA family oxidoreductase [Spirochaetaceae bacterium]|nr:MAG: Gfo/Idh/MocA family oxidoreductase [Spirochaetaceae bacterium]
MDQKKLGIGFIGAGEISILHGRAIRQIPGAYLVGLWNRTEPTARKRGKEEGCKVYKTPEELVSDDEIEAVFVCTNLETHLRFTRLALEAGKHVLVEKPICSSVAEVEEMKAVAEQSGRICVPGHNMIHEASLQRARRLIANGEIGPVVSCYVMYNIYHGDERAATLPGVVRHLLTHPLYTMMYLVGRPKRVAAFKANRNHSRQPEKEDLAMVLLELQNGGIAHLCVSFAADDLSPSPWTYTIKVIGTAGTTHYTYQDWVEVKQGISHSHTYTAYQDTITNEDRAFVDLCITGQGKPLSDLDDALWAQKATEAVEKSIAKRVVVDIG